LGQEGHRAARHDHGCRDTDRSQEANDQIADRALAERYRFGDIWPIYDCCFFGKWSARSNPILVTMYRVQSFSD
jgi:hypothetical protein